MMIHVLSNVCKSYVLIDVKHNFLSTGVIPVKSFMVVDWLVGRMSK